ncbi:hypothetical protein Hanom_Chr01g00027271 [Helianthus anomalus]
MKIYMNKNLTENKEKSYKILDHFSNFFDHKPCFMPADYFCFHLAIFPQLHECNF